MEEGIELANRLECNLHILYTFHQSKIAHLFQMFRGINKVAEKKQQLRTLQGEYAAQMKNGLLLSAVFKKGDAIKAVTDYILSHEVDMVYIGNHQRTTQVKSSSFRLAVLKGQPNCTVLVFKSGKVLQKLQKIIIPVTGSFPANSIRVAIYLGLQFNGTIHLVGNSTRELSSFDYLSKAYRFVKDNTVLPVICKTITDNNLVHAVQKYAGSLEGGIIIAGNSSKLSTANENILDNFFTDAKVPVMLVG